MFILALLFLKKLTCVKKIKKEKIKRSHSFPKGKAEILHAAISYTCIFIVVVTFLRQWPILHKPLTLNYIPGVDTVNTIASLHWSKSWHSFEPSKLYFLKLNSKGQPLTSIASSPSRIFLYGTRVFWPMASPVNIDRSINVEFFLMYKTCFQNQTIFCQCRQLNYFNRGKISISAANVATAPQLMVDVVVAQFYCD